MCHTPATGGAVRGREWPIGHKGLTVHGVTILQDAGGHPPDRPLPIPPRAAVPDDAGLATPSASVDPSSPPTPAFVVDAELLATLTDRFRAALDRHWPRSVLSYSVKTNSLPWVLGFMRRRGVWAEVVSDREYELALHLGHSPDRIVYNGPIKSRARLRSALRAHSLVNLDARREVTWTAELAREEPDLQIAVGLRVNWDLEARCPGESTTGTSGSRFGFAVDNGELDVMIEELRAAGVRIAGLHLHRGSRTQSVDVHRAGASVAAEIIRSRGLDLDWIDVGGGFFGRLEGSPTFDDYVVAIREELEPVVDPDRTALVVEPGGALIAVPVEFHASVLDVKHTGSSTFVVTDGSRTNIDPLFHRRTPFDLEITSDGTPTASEQIVSGFTCMEDDRLAHLQDAPELAVGDRLTFRRVGAYTMCFQPQFIEYLPAVHVRHGGRLTEVRSAWGVDEYLQGSTWETAEDAALPGAGPTGTSDDLSAPRRR